MSHLPMWLADRWAARIRELFDKKINDLRMQDPGFEARLKEQAEKEVLEELGIAEVDARLKDLEDQAKQIENEIAKLNKMRSALAMGDDPDTNKYYSSYAVSRKIGEATRAKLAKLMEDHPVGAEILELQEGKGNAVHSVTLATGPDSLKELVASIANELGVGLGQAESLALQNKEEDLP